MTKQIQNINLFSDEHLQAQVFISDWNDAHDRGKPLRLVERPHS
jgi:hypothetical protein